METYFAHAKINLFLRIVRRREDGYHDIETLFQRIGGPADRLTFERAGTHGLELEYGMGEIEKALAGKREENLVVRAYQALADYLRADVARKDRLPALGGVRVVLEKEIPIGSGLGGGSSDAATTLLALNRLFSLDLDPAALSTVAARLGADVPFFLGPPAAIGQGRGEILTPLVHSAHFWVVLAFPGIHISTAQVYGRYRPGAVSDRGDLDGLVEALRQKDLSRTLALLHNEMEFLAFELEPSLGRLRAALEVAAGRPARMSGSGCTLFTLADTEENARRLAAKWREAGVAQVVVAPFLEDEGTDRMDCPSDNRRTPAKAVREQLHELKVAMIGLRSLTASGGIETMVKQVASHMARMGLTVTVYCRTKYNKGRVERFGDVRLVNLPTIYTKHLEAFVHTFLASVAAVWSGHRVVHYQALGPALFSFLPRLFGRKSVVTIQGLDWKRGKWGALARGVLKVAEACAVYLPNRTVVCSKALQRYFKRRYNRDVIYIPNPIEEAKHREFDRVSRFGIEKNRYILFLGRIVSEKGLHVLIDAFENLATDMKLVVAGDAHHEKEYGLGLMDRVARSGARGAGRLRDRVVFTGALFGEEKEEILSNAYAFVLPSSVEGMSLALLEAMGHGICPLVSDIAENLEVIEPMKPDKPVGLSFRCGDAESLRRELEKLIADPDSAREIGKNAREKVRHEYDAAGIAEQYVHLYREITGIA